MPERLTDQVRSIQIMRKLLRTTPNTKLDKIMCKLITAPANTPERYGTAGQGPNQLTNDDIPDLLYHLVEAYNRKDRVVCLVFDPVVNLCASYATPVGIADMELIQARTRREAYVKAFDILVEDGALECFEEAVERMGFEGVPEGIEGVLRYANDHLISVSLPCGDKVCIVFWFGVGVELSWGGVC